MKYQPKETKMQEGADDWGQKLTKLSKKREDMSRSDKEGVLNVKKRRMGMEEGLVDEDMNKWDMQIYQDEYGLSLTPDEEDVIEVITSKCGRRWKGILAVRKSQQLIDVRRTMRSRQ